MGRSRKKLCSKSGQCTGKADSQSGKDSKKQEEDRKNESPFFLAGGLGIFVFLVGSSGAVPVTDNRGFIRKLCCA